LKPGTLSNVPCFVLILIALNDLSEKSKAIYYLVVLVSFIFSVHLFIGSNNLTSFDFKVIGFVTPIGGLLYGLGRIIFQLLKKKNNKVRIIKWYIKY
jgi:uncharacterized membrane protein YgdD (TMEM256/DUF423 family)